jgi:prepilin peptidase CpaA
MPESLSLVKVVEGLSLLLAAGVLLAAAVQDARKFKISNGFSIALAALFPVYALAAGAPILPHVIVGVIVLACGLAMFALHLLGGGDVKLLSAAAIWAGPGHIAPLLFTTTFLGGFLALGFALVALSKQKKREKSAGGEANEGDVVPWQKAPVPYGIAIACGGWYVLYKMAQPFFA